MKRYVIPVVSALVVTLTVTVLAAGDKARELKLQQAIELIESKGDLAKATPLFEEVAKSDDRALAARGLLHLARAQERYGKGDALATFQRIVTEFGGLQETAGISNVLAEARAKVAATAQKSTGLVERKIWDDFGDAVSPDGSYITLTDWETGDLAVHDVMSGRNRRVTNNGKWNGSFAEGGLPSRDGRTIAYAWNNDRDCQLRTIDLNGGQPRIVPAQLGKAYVWPLAWSPDGKSILVTIDRGPARGPQTRDLSFITIADGSIRLVRQFSFELDGVFQMNPALSPDGRFVAYNRRPVPGKVERDIYMLSLTSGDEMPVVQHQADDDLLGWFPDGSRLLFASDRSGTSSIWATRIVDSKGTDPTLIRKDAGNVNPMGFTREGHFYYGTAGGRESDIYIASVDPSSGLVENPLTRLDSRLIGNKVHGSWSPTGDRIAYVQTPPVRAIGPNRDVKLGIQSVATGQARVLSPALENIQYPTWLPDGRAVVVQGRDLDGRQGLFLINLDTAEVTPVARREPANDVQRMNPALSTDGQRVFFRWTNPALATEAGIAVRDVKTGAEQKILNRPVSVFALSPDGTRLATVGSLGESLFIMPSNGGNGVAVSPTETAWSSTALAWSGDGKFLFVSRLGSRGQEVWRVSVDGTRSVNTGISWSGQLSRLAVHPDGRQLALSTSKASVETRVLENLPVVK